MRLLIVEDDPECGAELAQLLGDQGFDTETVKRGSSAVEHCGAVDAVLLDLCLPDISGFEVCWSIRAVSSVPIIFVTGRGDEFHQVLGLKLGADDYVVKPYGRRELTARVEAAIRRADPERQSRQGQTERADVVQEFGPLRIDVGGRRVTVGNREVLLTRMEFDLLVYLAGAPERTLTREEIMAEVWGYEAAHDTRTLTVHVAGLRKKLGMPGLIETVRGVGLRFVA